MLTWLAARLKGSAPAEKSDPASMAVPAGQRVYAIGDIHGCAALLDRMHQLIRDDLVRNPAAEPGMVYLGDYCDRGPDSRGVYERLVTPDAGLPPAIPLKGNHEEMFLQFIRSPDMFPVWRDLGGLETLVSYGVDPKLLRMQRDFTAARDHCCRACRRRTGCCWMDWRPVFSGAPISFVTPASDRVSRSRAKRPPI